MGAREQQDVVRSLEFVESLDGLVPVELKPPHDLLDDRGAPGLEKAVEYEFSDLLR